VVYPAAGFVQVARLHGADTVEFNLEKTSNDSLFEKHIYGKCSQTLPEFIDCLLHPVQEREI
jgi:NAD-dependent deacetylase